MRQSQAPPKFERARGPEAGVDTTEVLREV
jgi:hypothetical protein